MASSETGLNYLNGSFNSADGATTGSETIPTVLPTVETPILLDDPEQPIDQQADADDPAIYVNANDAAKSLVITVAKNAGLRVYDLNGQQLQAINPGVTAENPEGIRYNNVDLLYGFQLGNQQVDLAVATDRRNDKIVIFKINPGATDGNYLQDITAPQLRTIFRPPLFEFQPFDEQSHAYGIAAYKSPVSGKSYAFVNRRNTGDMAQLELIDAGDGTIRTRLVRSFTVPVPDFAGVEEAPEAQLEGMVVDQETGFLYIGQEDVGIWKYEAEPKGKTAGVLIDRVKELGGEHLEADVEGLTIYYGPDGTGYLLASSQGDNKFIVYSREGNNDYLHTFAVGSNGAIDSVEESDGADVINLPLGPQFPFGLFVTQDGSNDPPTLVEDDGELENISTNFKYVPWQNIANGFAKPLLIDTTSYNPRQPQAQSLLNGVASGDTTDDSTVLWTRSNFRGRVTFAYAIDPDFTQIIDTRTRFVTDPLKPVKATLRDLEANTEYYYRVTDAAGATATGRFKTAAEQGTYGGLSFGAAGDWRGELSPYPAVSNVPDFKLDFFIELGDTIYADYPSPAVRNPDGTEKEQAETLDEFRLKQSEVYGKRFGENVWGEVRASTSILATIDDHEVTNDFSGGALASSDPRFNDATPGKLINQTQLYRNGLQAFQEYNPLRDRFYLKSGDPRVDGRPQLYRYNTYGSDAASIILDARSFRDAGLPAANPGDPASVAEFLTASFNPERTMLGRPQVERLKRDLLKAETAGTTWKFVTIPEPMQNLGVLAASDRFEGYAAERTEILKFIDDNSIDNVVFVSADIHGTLVNNLTYQLGAGQPQIGTSAFEVTTGSVAFDAPFGPTVAELAFLGGLITPEQKDFYDALPVSNDGDQIVNDKDDFIQQLVNAQLAPLGYDPLGLSNNLPVAEGLINAKLLRGDYLSTQTYGWTKFDVNPRTQKLTVTTYGIPYYSLAELEADPSKITSLIPRIVSRFEVTPSQQGRAGDDILTGFAGDDTLRGLGGDDILRGRQGDDLLVGGAGRDTFVLAASAGTDTIADFARNDKIKLAGGLTFEELAIVQGSGTQSDDTLIRLAASQAVLAIVTGAEAETVSRSILLV